jgi:hypothetical protein
MDTYAEEIDALLQFMVREQGQYRKVGFTDFKSEKLDSCSGKCPSSIRLSGDALQKDSTVAALMIRKLFLE